MRVQPSMHDNLASINEENGNSLHDLQEFIDEVYIQEPDPEAL